MLVDAIVACNKRDTEWGEKYRVIMLRLFNKLTEEIGLSTPSLVEALRGDMENNARKITVAIPCDQIKDTEVDKLVTMMNWFATALPPQWP